MKSKYLYFAVSLLFFLFAAYQYHRNHTAAILNAVAALLFFLLGLLPTKP